MPAPAIILAVGAVVLVLMVAWVPLRDLLAKRDLQGECARLSAEIRVKRTQGGSVDEVAKLEAALATCHDAMRAQGLSVDELAEHLASTRDIDQQLREEFAHLRSTDYADILKRGSTRGTILRLGSDLARRYEAALESIDRAAPDALEQLQRVRTALEASIADSGERRSCYALESPGCGRYAGSTEDDAETKARAEVERILNPLRAVRAQLLEELQTIGGAPLAFERGATAATGVRR